jgi:non-specific serine/threonine protein kinase
MVSPSFELTAENGMWITEICRRLDGMPLAIELAAARVRALSVKQIAGHLDDRFHLLTSGSRTAPLRHQTLEAALDWSYALLSEVEQKVLQRLSVFAGGWMLEAAEVVCAGEGVEEAEVLDVLSQLIDKSLVVADKPNDEARYNFLETIRQYGHEKLVEAGGTNEIKDKHLSYYRQWVGNATPHLLGPEQFGWLSRFETEHPNICAALEWCQLAPNGADQGVPLAAEMGYFWKLRGYHTEGRMWLSAVLAHKDAQHRTITRAQALHRAAVLAFFQSDYSVVRTLAEQSLAISRELGAAGRLEVANALEILAEAATETGDYATAPELYEQALTLYREVGDLVGIGDTLKMLGWQAMRTGDYQRAESQLEEGLIACRQSGDLRQITSALAGLGELAVRRGQYERASAFLRESLEIGRRSGEKWGIAIALGSLGWLALNQGDLKEMNRLLGESLQVRLETGDKSGIAWCLEKLAEASSLRSRFRPAAIIFGAASALRATVGSAMDAADRPAYEHTRAKIRAGLGEHAFAAAWAKGSALTVKVAVDYALSEPAMPGAESTRETKEAFGGLTRREREVAVWIAKGKSNREIARAMTVGVRTIETYVTRILNKLGFDSRVQIATWTIEKGFGERSAGEQG